MPIYDEKTDFKILRVLLEKGKVPFNVLRNEIDVPKQTLRLHLNTLGARGLVYEERDQWKRGKKMACNLTEKGRSWLVEKSAGDLKEASRNLQEFVSQMSKPDKIYRYRRAGSFPPTQEELDRGGLDQEGVRAMFRHKEETIGPLRSVFFELAKVLVQVEGFIDAREDLENVEFWFRKGRSQWRIYAEKAKEPRSCTSDHDAIHWAQNIEAQKKG